MFVFFRNANPNKGKKAEKEACAYLKKQGLKLIQTNFNTPLGEIDLIMEDAKTLVFIEVRYRKNADFGGAIASVNRKKQQKMIKASQLFLIRHKKYQSIAMRFDVIGITPKEKKQNITWVKNAFLVSF